MNVNYFFHNTYYDYILDEELNAPNLRGKNLDVWYKKQLSKKLVPENSNKILSDAQTSEGEALLNVPDIQRFYLKTTYPGLLIGTGGAHDSSQMAKLFTDKVVNPSVKLSINLDYVNGLPIIPASSVKGTLRSVFEYYPEYVKGVLADIKKDESWNEKCDQVITDILEEIFDYNDIFFDAVPVKGGKNNQIFGFDYITSHKHASKPEYDGLVNPNPVKMIKVLPNVVYAFSFICHDSNVLSAEEKKELFSLILQDIGIGAKTNTGFGNLVPADEVSYNNMVQISIDETKRIGAQ